MANHHSRDSADEELSDDERRGHRLRFELIFASFWLAFGLFLLPALIFWVGAGVLGAYGENAGLSTFYADFYGDLADASGRAWTLALGPLVLIYLLRAVFIGVQPEPAAREEHEDELPSPPRRAPIAKEPARKESSNKESIRKEPARKSSARPARVEPRMSGD